MDHRCCPENLHHFKPFYSDLLHSPRSPTGSRCDTLSQAPISLGHFKVFTLRFELLDLVPFCRKKKKNQCSAYGPALCTELGGFAMEKLQKSQKAACGQKW